MNVSEGYAKLKDKTDRFVDYVKLSKILSQKKEAKLPYAYPCTNYMDSILSNGLVRKALQLFADKYCKEQILLIKTSGQLVTENNYPRFNAILQTCYKSLDVIEIPEVYITNRLKGINALSIGTDSEPVILISQKSIMALSDGELKFMIGHELGHILQKNLMCHTITGMLDNLNNKSEVFGPIVSDLIDVPLNQWYRCAEYTADRAGLICCQNIEEAKSLFAKLIVLKNSPKLDDFYELFNAHPLITKRINMLSQFGFKLCNSCDRIALNTFSIQ